jgi:hypothetical protein
MTDSGMKNRLGSGGAGGSRKLLPPTTMMAEEPPRDVVSKENLFGAKTEISSGG